MSSELSLRNDLAGELYQNARDFLNQALIFLLEDSGSQKVAKFTVVNLQMSVELLVKWYLVEHVGTAEIFDRDFVASSDPRADIWSGRLKTIKYEACKHRFIRLRALDRPARKLLDDFQKQRNRIVHSFMALSYNDCLSSAADLVFNVIRHFFSERDGHFGQFLDKSIYNRLITFEPYVEKAIARAQGADADEILTCWNCRHETMLHKDDGFWCLACGTTGDERASPYVACPFCGKRAFVLDGLNIDHSTVRGECMVCGRDGMMEKCVDCGKVFCTEAEGDYQNDGTWHCEDCGR